MRRLLVAFKVLACLAVFSPAAAQGPTGIAIVEAPEAGSGVCFAGNPETGFSCARDKCIAESGLEPRDCLRVRWCYPSGWTADLFLQTADGFHFHRYICGSGSRAEMISLAKAVCSDPQKADYLECSFARAWDPDGNDVEVDEQLRAAR
ncbi:hypothetical protein [Jiella marina]|uniref:hypothetical protein n=1 Tax=Jiella sp. LLJ827 TaxID=2917712 RepID=UPI002100712E|nr:hypothetical protein [Jiella sp. LLJ827]MCQ0990003.1 hypothetical protein [Jiella sp. LLJ827]